MTKLKKHWPVLLIILLAIAISFFLGYKTGQRQMVSERCQNILASKVNYSQLTKGEVELVNFARKECLKEVLR